MWDLVTGELIWDDRLIELFGYDRESFDRATDAFNSRVHPDDRPSVEEAIQRALEVTGDYDTEHRVVLPGGRVRWVTARGKVLRDDYGMNSRMLGAAYDTTARRAAQERVEHEGRRVRLLGEVTEVLTGALDAEIAVARLAQVVVPALGDWCTITLIDAAAPGPRAGLRAAGSWHADPAARPLVEQYGRLRLAALRDGDFVARSFGSTSTQVIDSGAAAAMKRVLAAGPVHNLIDMLAPESAVLLPLVGRDRPVGALSLFTGLGRSPLTAEEVTLATDVAARAGLALDSARLHRQQLHLAEGLQRSLLTVPPTTSGFQIAVRYTPAAEAVQVGGDWYDTFTQPSGTPVLVIGDVIGHDTEAAAAMGQVRSMLRAIAAVEDDSPAQILAKLDRVMDTLHVDTTATAIVARIEQDDTDRAQGRARLRWSNAGHPPAVVLLHDGTVHMLSGPRSNLLLGITPTARDDFETVLAPGATLLLYTDGLVERRDQTLEEGLQRLEALLRDMAGTGLDQLCDDLLTHLLSAHPEDDVALIALRLD